MSLRIDQCDLKDVDWTEVHQVCGDRLWLSPGLLAEYGAVDVYLVRRRSRLLACWPVPVSSTADGDLVAARSYRLLPYTGPSIASGDGLRRFAAHDLLASEVGRRYDTIDLPLTPEPDDLIPYVSRGVTPVWRTTYHLPTGVDLPERASAMTRRALRSAVGRLEVSRDPATAFDLSLGLGARDAEELSARSRIVRKMGEGSRAVTIAAYEDGVLTGQLLAARDGESGYLLHSWYRHESPRGVSALMISAAFEWACEEARLRYFDLYGSVLYGVARFYASFGAVVRPYAQLRRLPATEGGTFPDYLAMR